MKLNAFLLCAIVGAVPLLAGCADEPAATVTTPASPTSATPATPTPGGDGPGSPVLVGEPCYKFTVSAPAILEPGDGATVKAKFENCASHEMALEHACLRGMDLAILKFYPKPVDAVDTGMPQAIGPEARYELAGTVAGLPGAPCATAPPHERTVGIGESLEYEVEWGGLYAPEGCEEESCAKPLPLGNYAFVANAVDASDETAYSADQEFEVRAAPTCVTVDIGPSKTYAMMNETIGLVGSAFNCGDGTLVLEHACLNPVNVYAKTSNGTKIDIDTMPCATAPPWDREIAPGNVAVKAVSWNTTGLAAGNYTLVATVMEPDGKATEATQAFTIVEGGFTGGKCISGMVSAAPANFTRGNSTNITSTFTNCGATAAALEHSCLRGFDLYVVVDGVIMSLGPDGISEPGFACATAPPWNREIAAGGNMTQKSSWNGFVQKECLPGMTGCVYPADAGRHLVVALAQTPEGVNLGAYAWVTLS